MQGSYRSRTAQHARSGTRHSAEPPGSASTVSAGLRRQICRQFALGFDRVCSFGCLKLAYPIQPKDPRSLTVVAPCYQQPTGVERSQREWSNRSSRTSTASICIREFNDPTLPQRATDECGDWRRLAVSWFSGQQLTLGRRRRGHAVPHRVYLCSRTPCGCCEIAISDPFHQRKTEG